MIRVAYDEIDVNGVLHVVSTINRQSSCMYGGMYAETMVFIGGIPGKLIWQGEDCEGSTRTHDRALNALRMGEADRYRRRESCTEGACQSEADQMSKFKVGVLVACVTSDEWSGSVGEVVSVDESGAIGVELGDGSVYPFDTFELEIIS